MFLEYGRYSRTWGKYWKLVVLVTALWWRQPSCMFLFQQRSFIHLSFESKNSIFIFILFFLSQACWLGWLQESERNIRQMWVVLTRYISLPTLFKMHRYWLCSVFYLFFELFLFWCRLPTCSSSKIYISSGGFATKRQDRDRLYCSTLEQHQSLSKLIRGNHGLGTYLIHS